ncbi:mevalonate kinase [archaeon]|jgi:mevalonate kinase|nr:mevalonate kinase [archaeon]
MMEITSPGKIILFGEHAVVYGKPAIAAPVNSLTTNVKLKITDDEISKIIITDKSLTPEERNRLEELLELVKKELVIKDNFHITIDSSVPISSGMGSSASLCVSIVKSLLLHKNNSVDVEELSKLALIGEKIFHGNPSGIDTNVISYNQTLFFQKKKKNEFIKIKKPLNILIADSGIKGSTKRAVSLVKKKYEENKIIYSKIFDDMEKISIVSKKAIEEGDIEKLGRMMTLNHALLKMIGISNEKLDYIFSSAIDYGAYGAKISGAGMGGNIIALVKEKDIENITEALRENGAVHVYHTVIK